MSWGLIYHQSLCVAAADLVKLINHRVYVLVPLIWTPGIQGHYAALDKGRKVVPQDRIVKVLIGRSHFAFSFFK
jgi:hypothetical protein